MIRIFDFGTALTALQEGKHVKRLGWNGTGQFVAMQNPDEHSKMTRPYLYLDTTNLQTRNVNASKGRVPWFPSQTDALAKDWEIVEIRKETAFPGSVL